MKFSNFLRRFNRGIALGIVLIIALVIYIIVDGIRFNQEKALIKDVLTEYTKISGDLILLPEEYREIGKTAPESVINKKIEDNKAVIDKYFTSTTNQYGYSLSESFKNQLENSLNENRKSGNVVESNEMSIIKIGQISKSGSNYAELEISIKIIVKATQNANYVRFFDTDYFGHMRDDNEEDLTITTETYEDSYTIAVKKVNGTWKIDDYSYSYFYGFSRSVQIGG